MIFGESYYNEWLGPVYRILIDKEEVGSIGATGAQSVFFENTVAKLAHLLGLDNPLYQARIILENSKMFVKDRYGNTQSAMHNVGYVLDTASSKMKQSFNGEYVMITPLELASSYLTFEEEELIKNLDELKNFEEFRNDPKTKDVAKNFHEIERELNARAKAEHMNTILINAKNALNSETEVNFSQLIDYLNELQKIYQLTNTNSKITKQTST